MVAEKEETGRKTGSCEKSPGPGMLIAGAGCSGTGMSLDLLLLEDFLLFFLAFVSDLTLTSCSAEGPTGPVVRAEGFKNGWSDSTGCEEPGTEDSGVEKTLPLERRASNLANCSAHLLFISSNWAEVT